jgi:outer membrane biosynthesis protein TonB
VGLLALVIFFAGREEDKVVPNNQPIQVSLTDEVGLVSAAPDPSPEPPAQQKGEDPQTPADSEIAPPEKEPDPVKKPDPPKPAAVPDNRDRRRPDQSSSNRTPQRNVTPSKDFLNGGGNFDGSAREPTPGKGKKEQATMTGEARANIGSAIARQVKPCADRQVIPADEATSIRVTVQLRLKRDGSLAGPIRIAGHEGVTEANKRYVARVDDAVEAIFAQCSPLRGLPQELYDVPGGWSVFTLRYRLTN